MGAALSVRKLLERRCADYGMTTQEASRAAGLPKQAIYRIIYGERTELWSRTRAAICRALDISPEVLDEAILVSLDESNGELGMGNGELRKCAKCGIRNTGWRETIRGGETLCPSCAQCVTVVPVEEMLTHRRAVLARMEAEENTSPGIARFTKGTVGGEHE